MKKLAYLFTCKTLNILNILENFVRKIVFSKVSMIRDIRDREIRIYTDAGRICRPLLIVENQKLLLKQSHIKQLKQREYNNYRWALFRCSCLTCVQAFISTLKLHPVLFKIYIRWGRFTIVYRLFSPHVFFALLNLLTALPHTGSCLKRNNLRSLNLPCLKYTH